MSRDYERQAWDFPSTNLVHSMLQLLTDLPIKDLKHKHCSIALLLFDWFLLGFFFFTDLHTASHY